jgi:Zn-finger nucleic acid-binding protein
LCFGKRAPNLADRSRRCGRTIRSLPFILRRLKFIQAKGYLERAKEDIYFAQRDRELIEKLKAQLHKVEKNANELRCPKCRGLLETYTFQGFVSERCQKCGGIWLDNGELEGIIKKFNRVSLDTWIHTLLAKEESTRETDYPKEVMPQPQSLEK